MKIEFSMELWLQRMHPKSSREERSHKSELINFMLYFN